MRKKAGKLKLSIEIDGRLIVVTEEMIDDSKGTWSSWKHRMIMGMGWLVLGLAISNALHVFNVVR